MYRSMIEVDSGGALVDKMPTEAMSLIANMAANSQQFEVRTQNPVRPVHEVSVSSSIDRQLASLTQVVQSLATSVSSMQTKPCEICSTPRHPIDMCPSL